MRLPPGVALSQQVDRCGAFLASVMQQAAMGSADDTEVEPPLPPKIRLLVGAKAERTVVDAA